MVQTVFTKIRNRLNEREDELLLNIDNIFDKTFFDEKLIKNNEKLTLRINASLEQGKLIENESNNNNNELNSFINDCLNIENNIKDILKIKDNLMKIDLYKKINIQFYPKEDGIKEMIDNIYSSKIYSK